MIPSIRLKHLKTLEIDVCDCDVMFVTDTQVIDCPNLLELLYRPLHGQKLTNQNVWSLPNLKKLKIYRSQPFMKSLKYLELLLISSYGREDSNLLKELPKLKFLDIHEIDAELFGWLDETFGRKVAIHYRGLPAQYVGDRVREVQDTFRHPVFDEERMFKEDDLEIYRDQFEQANDEIHFYSGFWILDSSRQIKPNFFSKFVDVSHLEIAAKSSLTQDELLDILCSFRNVKSISFGNRNFDSSFYEKLLPQACPHLSLK